MALDGEMRQEGIYFRDAHVSWMSLAVEEYEAANPADVGLAGVRRKVASDRRIRHPVEKPRWLVARAACGVHRNDLPRAA